MIKKKIALCVTAMSIISMSVLSACGKTVDIDQKNDNENTSITVDAIDTDEDITNTEEDTVKADEGTTEDSSFGLKDFEGFYCMTGTEQIEDYEITYTYGYQFNGDGTGVCFGQDVVDITWNETEIHFADYTENFTMEPGKLTVGDLVYDKIEGHFIAPNPYDVDVDNVENGIYYAYIDENGISEEDGMPVIRAEIYTEDSYDIVDINSMTEGDVIYINGTLLPVFTVDHTDSGIININGGVEEGGSALVAVDESNCFVYAGMDMERSYTRQGIVNFVVSDDLKFVNKSDPTEEKEYTGSEAVSALKELVNEYPLNCHTCSITVDNGAIVEINRLYIP